MPGSTSILLICGILSFAALMTYIPWTRSIMVGESEEGIPIVDYGYVDSTFVGEQMNPTTIAIRALQSYHNYSTSLNETYKASFLANVEWLYGNIKIHKNYAIYEHPFPWPPYDLDPGWRSGLAQGLALETMVKAYKITGNASYLDMSRKILNSFGVNLSDGGFTYKDPTEGYWYEEYAYNNSRHYPMVLNGMMFSLLSLYDYYNYTGDIVAKHFFDKGMISLTKNLWKYDKNGTYSSYDTNQGAAPLEYHEIHLNQLKNLYKVTNEDLLKNYYTNWSKSLSGSPDKLDTHDPTFRPWGEDEINKNLTTVKGF